MKVELLIKKVSDGRLFKLNSRMLAFRKQRLLTSSKRFEKIEDRNGLYTTRIIHLPFKVEVKYVKEHKSLKEELGIGNLSFDWLVDEFDSSFNKLAAASLQYHMDYAVTYCSDEKREKYTELRNRLLHPAEGIEKPGPRHDHGGDIEETLFSDRRNCSECDEYYKSYMRYDDEVRAVIEQARKDFIEVIPSLWS